jgi:membrane protein
VLGWFLASLGFAFYANKFGSSGTTYSSLGAVIILLTRMNVIGRFILIGGAINAEIALAVPAGKEPGETTAVGSLTRV